MKKITKIGANEPLVQKKKLKVAAYCRVSTASDEQLISLETQKAHYEKHIRSNDEWEYPRKSTCDCPLANGKKIICKHIVAVSLCLDASEADRFKNEKTIYASEEEERRAKKYDKYMGFAKTMSPRELREAYVELMIELDEYRLKEKYGK